MTEEKLLPCPFCGKEAKIFQRYDWNFVVKCKNPGCRCELNCGGYGYDTEEYAAEAWNRSAEGWKRRSDK